MASKSSNARNPTEEEKRAAEETLKVKIFKFINNGNHSDETVNDQNFRDVIDYIRGNSDKLQDYKHMGNRKLISIQFSCFQELLAFVSGKVKKVREWYVKHTVSIVC